MVDQQPEERLPVPFLSDEERIRLLETNITDYAIVLIDPRERIVSWNAGAERILGYRESEIVGEHAAIIFTPEDRSDGEAEREFKTAREEGRAEDERWHLKRDGTRFWGLGILTGLYDDERNLRGYAKILRDFTARKDHEDCIAALNARLQVALTETHHRIKNNLQIVCAMIDFHLLAGGDMIPAAEYRRLSGQVRTLAAVHDVQTANMKAGGGADEISLKALLEQVLSLLQSTAGMSDVEYALAETYASAQKASSIALIVNELVHDAFQHGNGKVVVTLAVQDHEATISVSNQGPGFARRDARQTGLQLVENLTHLDLRGQVAYETQPEGGGCVRVQFSPDR